MPVWTRQSRTTVSAMVGMLLRKMIDLAVSAAEVPLLLERAASKHPTGPLATHKQTSNANGE